MKYRVFDDQIVDLQTAKQELNVGFGHILDDVGPHQDKVLFGLDDDEFDQQGILDEQDGVFMRFFDQRGEILRGEWILDMVKMVLRTETVQFFSVLNRFKSDRADVR